MGLVDDLNNEANFVTPKRAWCSVCELFKKLSKAEQVALQARFDDESISHTSLSTVLKKNGHNLSDQTIGRHRRKQCTNGAK